VDGGNRFSLVVTSVPILRLGVPPFHTQKKKIM
jgi:hypothetical protein